MRYPEDSVQSQYAASKTIRALVDFINERIDPSEDIILFYEKIFNINTAEGYGLDNWGRILGLGRVIQVEETDFFGFNGSELQPFDQQVFFTFGATRNYPLEDSLYRRLLLCKAAANISASDNASLNYLLQLLFGDDPIVWVTQTGVMEAMIFYNRPLTLVERSLLAQTFVPPRPAGVLFRTVEATPEKLLGFAGSLLYTFDNGVFWDDNRPLPPEPPPPPPPPPPIDPYFNDVLLLLHLDGAEGDDRFIDNSQNNWRVSAAKFSDTPYYDTSNFKIGDASCRFASMGLNTAAHLVVASDITDFSPFQLLSVTDFTVECWINAARVEDGIVSCFVTSHVTNNNLFAYGVGTNSAGYYGGRAVAKVGSSYLEAKFEFPSVIPLDSGWHHCAWCRDSNGLRFYWDGKTIPITGALPPIWSSIVNDTTQTKVSIGSTVWGNNWGFTGNIDELRITKNHCRYTEDFEPDLEPFPDTGE